MPQHTYLLLDMKTVLMTSYCRIPIVPYTYARIRNVQKNIQWQLLRILRYLFLYEDKQFEY